MAEFDESIISDKDRGYFAAKPAEDCVQNLEGKIDNYFKTLENLGWWDKLKDAYAIWSTGSKDSIGEAHQVNFSGDDGEFANLIANHYYNIGKNMHTMVTSVRPAMETRAVNTDAKSQIQTKLGNGLLDYYMRGSGKKVEKRLKMACEYAIALGAGHIKLSWNQNLGEMTNGEKIMEAQKRRQLGEAIKLPLPEYEGDIDFTLLSPFDIVEDITREDIKQDWKIVRSYKNKFDLIKVYPQFTDELLKIETKSEKPNMSCMYLSLSDKITDDIPVWEFYHERTESVPEGRYILFCNKETIMYDGPLPYRAIPIYSIKPSQVLGTPLGRSDMFELMPLQEAINGLYSTILTNQMAFGVQSVLVPTTGNFDPYQVTQGLNIIKYNPQGGEPKPLQLTATPPEVFKFLEFLIQTQETISGINSVVRGNPEASLRSGSAIAMIQSNAIQYMSNLQAEYVALIEDVGLGMIQMLIDFADSPRIANIVGESGRSYVKEFKGDDLRAINRVVVDSANPMSKTIAGRINMADNLLQYGEITPKQYMNVVNTGNLETATDATTTAEMAIKKENEMMMDGEEVAVLYFEDHMQHIQGHKQIVSDPELKRNPELVRLIGEHIQEHVRLLRETDPDLLMTLGQQPLRPQGAPPPQGQPPAPAPEGQVPGNPALETPQQQAIAQQGAQPQEMGARLPAGFEESPLSGAQNLERIQGQ
mgnify:CR=1 FL=1